MTLEEALLKPVLQLHGGISSASAILNNSGVGGLLLDQLNPSSTTWPGAYYDSDGFNASAGNVSLLDDPDYQNSNKFILPWWRQIIWTVLFAGMIVVATGGNLIVIWIVLAHKRMRTVTNYFLVNLSIADAMVSTLNVIFNYTYMLNSHWPFGTLYCKISQFIAVITICASVFTLMAISIDRYVAIVNPLRPRMGKRMTLCIALAIWAVGAVLSLPMLLFFTTFTQDFPNGEVRVICYAGWPDQDSNGQSYDEYLYNVIFMFLTYFLPIGAMTFTYARIGVELWGSQSIGEATQRQLDNIRNKRRVVKMMMVVVMIFAVCWLPFHVYFIVTSYLPELTNEPYIQELYLAIYWLAMSNSMYNPIIYCWMNSRFRRGFAQFFSCVHWYESATNRRSRARRQSRPATAAPVAPRFAPGSPATVQCDYHYTCREQRPRRRRRWPHRAEAASSILTTRTEIRADNTVTRASTTKRVCPTPPGFRNSIRNPTAFPDPRRRLLLLLQRRRLPTTKPSS